MTLTGLLILAAVCGASMLWLGEFAQAKESSEAVLSHYESLLNESRTRRPARPDAKRQPRAGSQRATGQSAGE